MLRDSATLTREAETRMPMQKPPPLPRASAPAKPATWWQRNWKWFVPVGCLGLLAIFTGFVVLIVAVVFGMIKSSDVYQGTLARARADQAVETALGSLVGLIFNSDLTIHNMIAALTYGPARVLGFEKLGTLETDAPADICIFDLHREWVVDPEQFVSKGKNTLLAGTTLRGKVMATFAEGWPVYMDESMEIKAKS